MNMENITTDKDPIELEREELNLLIRRGVKFEVTTKVAQRRKGLKGFFMKPEIIEKTSSYEIHEPTLSVLDRLSEIWLQMAVDEDALQESSVILSEAKRMAYENAERMARIIAIAVLGEDYHITEVNRFGQIRKYNNDKELNRLTYLFKHTIKPSKLYSLSTMITNISNLGDFLNSMRLMSGARSTQPKTSRIE